MEKVRPPPPRGLPDEEAEQIGLTTGKTVPSRKPLGYVILAFVLFLVLISGIAVGYSLAHFYSPKRLMGLIPGSTPPAALNFLAVGDWGRNGTFNQTETAVGMGEVAAGIQADFVISTGDNFYDQGLASPDDPQFSASFSNIYTASWLQKPWFSVLGNHDYIRSSEAEISSSLRARDPRWHCERFYRRRFDACSLPTKGPCPHTVEFFFIDTSPFLKQYWGAGRETLNFTSYPPYSQAVGFQIWALREALTSSGAFWKVVVGHHPVYSSGEHGGSEELQAYLLPLLKEFEVDVYINGHDHNLELIRLPDINMHFITTGAGSKVRTTRTNAPPDSTLFYSDRQGFVSGSITGGTAEIRFHNMTGGVIHTLTLARL